MFLGILVAIIMGNGNTEVDVTPYVIGMTGVFLLVVLLFQKTVTKDAAKCEREKLAQLFTTPEQVQEFGAEMTVVPRYDLTAEDQHVLFTEHYIALKYQNMGWPYYRFARLSEIAKNDFALTSNESKAYGLGKMYLVDLKNVNGKKLIGVSVAGKKKMEESEQLLTKHCPGIQLKKHKLF